MNQRSKIIKSRGNNQVNLAYSICLQNITRVTVHKYCIRSQPKILPTLIQPYISNNMLLNSGNCSVLLILKAILG